MSRRRGPAVLGLAALVAPLTCAAMAGCAEKEAETEPTTIGVAVAPSLSEAFSKLSGIFEDENPGIRVDLELGRSDVIAEGLAARTDINVFASAGEEAMTLATAQGTVTDVALFARNNVVVAVPSGNPRQVGGLRDLARPDLKVGLCQATAPCGEAAEALLAAAGVVPPAVEWSEGSRGLTARLADNELHAGIIYRTDVAASRGWVTQVDLPPHERALMQASGTTRYVLARVPGGEEGADSRVERTAAADFRELVLSERGRRVLEDAGLATQPG